MKAKTSLLTIDFKKVPIELIAWTQMLTILEANVNLTTEQIKKNLANHVAYLKNSLVRKFSEDTLTEIELWETVIAHIESFVGDTAFTTIMANNVIEQTYECPN